MNLILFIRDQTQSRNELRFSHGKLANSAAGIAGEFVPSVVDSSLSRCSPVAMLNGYGLGNCPDPNKIQRHRRNETARCELLRGDNWPSVGQTEFVANYASTVPVVQTDLLGTLAPAVVRSCVRQTYPGYKHSWVVVDKEQVALLS